MLRLKSLMILDSRKAMSLFPNGKLLINTINAHSYNTAQKDKLFAEALQQGDVLIPDGASIVKACRWLNARSKPTERIARLEPVRVRDEQAEYYRRKMFFHGQQ